MNVADEQMMGQTFAVVPVPVRDTVLGGLTAETEGSRIDLVARLEDDPDGRCYAVDFVVTGITAQHAQQAEASLQEAFTFLVRKECRDGRWHAQGRLPLANITSRALRVLSTDSGAFAEPWLDIVDGIACVHLRPRGGEADEAFRAELERTLRDRGLGLPVQLEILDDATHRHHVRCLDHAATQSGALPTA